MSRRFSLIGLRLWVLACALIGVQGLYADEIEQILSQQCAQCHRLTGPAPGDVTAVRTRKGPDLHYAGLKYKTEWVGKWLAKPYRIRPAGMYYGSHLRSGEAGDVIDESSLVSHPVLESKMAMAVAERLSTFRSRPDLIRPGEYQPGTISLSMGEMMFDKFKGCLACHEIEPGYGGLSGPEVYTVANRLQEDFLISYMRDPQAWAPGIFMPTKPLADRDLQKLVHYFRALAREAQP